jgi:malonate-semialdehyde dehydrogenase (acetylating) / methylmalonate-semialdehyde dehydrogenase
MGRIPGVIHGVNAQHAGRPDRQGGGRSEGEENQRADEPDQQEDVSMKTINHWIDGRIVESTSGSTSPVFDPATGEQAAEVGLASVAEVDAAVAAAKAAFPAWRATSLSRRAEIMFRLRELIDANRKEIAAMVTAEHGKVLTDALGEVARGLENVEFACGIPQLIKGDYSEQAAGGIDVYSIRQPLGVVAGITPFNFPAMVPMWMFANALACGNTFVLKPSEKDPSVSLYLAELLAQAGLPAGCFNVVQGDKVAVDRILEHDDIAAVSFVGSTPIAKYIYETGTANGKRVQALGGAKNHMLVLADADVDMAADAAVGAGYGSAGERCMAISVVLAADSIADELVTKIADRIPSIKVGPGSEAGNEMGPLITAEHRDRVKGYVDNAPDEGATIVVDGREGVPSSGYFLNPTLLDGVTPEMACYRDEIFGPVLSVMRVSGYQEGIDTINANPYANGTAIFTRDGGAARQFQFDVQVGMVGVNVPVPVPVSYYSFGGWKASLFGDTHMYGPEGVNFYTRGKVVTSRWPDPATSTVNLGFPETR